MTLGLLHGGVTPAELSRAWLSEPAAAIALGLLSVLYGLGLDRAWRRAGIGRGIRRIQAACFAAGFAVLGAALLSPLHALGESLFAAHMTQHVLLMSVAAPLLVLGQPLLVLLWVLDRDGRQRAARVLRSGPVRSAWHLISRPAAAWLIHALAIWLWHVPALYDASVRSAPVHALQHASFLGAALLFWWVLLHRLAQRERAGIGVLYLFTTAVHTSLLGALLTFAGEPWYAAYAETTASWGLSPLEDLQLGGLIMWVPGWLPYLVALLAVASRWLAERRVAPTRPAAALGTLALLMVLAACDRSQPPAFDGTPPADVQRGRALIRSYGCHSCHYVPGVRGANGRVGPALDGLNRRTYIAGSLPNTPENLLRFIADPQSLRPGTGMPDVHASDRDARDMAAYLYMAR